MFCWRNDFTTLCVSYISTHSAENQIVYIPFSLITQLRQILVGFMITAMCACFRQMAFFFLRKKLNNLPPISIPKICKILCNGSAVKFDSIFTNCVFEANLNNSQNEKRTAKLCTKMYIYLWFWIYSMGHINVVWSVKWQPLIRSVFTHNFIIFKCTAILSPLCYSHYI